MMGMIVLPDYRVRQRDYLLDITRAITSQLDLAEVLRQVLSASISMLSGEVGAIALYDEDENLAIQSALGIAPEDYPTFNDLLTDFQTVGFEQERLTLRTRQIAKRLNLPLRQIVALPLLMSGEPMGLIIVFRAFSGLASENDRQILQSFADQAAIAVHNARLYAQTQQETKRLETLLEQSGDGIMLLDAERRIIRCNRALSRLTGWSAEAALGRLDEDILRWLSRKPGPEVSALLAPDWPADQTLYQEGEIERLDGLPVSLAITYAKLTKEDGTLGGVIANVRDISNLRKAEEMKNTFISVISHELKTPVALIKGYAGTLRREDAQWKPEDYREALTVIEEEADRLTSLIENLLSASKLQAEGMRLSLADVDLAKLAARTVERFRTQTNKHHFRLDFPPAFPLIQGDETRLRQVLDNLLSNAIKYSPKGGEIVVRGVVEAEAVTVSVKDEGVGLAAEQLAKVFERFYRVDDALTRTTQGTGLGLYLARAVVEAHGGRIWVESQPNQGATFYVSLPRP
jgi:PAS domain S-box-containing protein